MAHQRSEFVPAPGGGNPLESDGSSNKSDSAVSVRSLAGHDEADRRDLAPAVDIK